MDIIILLISKACSYYTKRYNLLLWLEAAYLYQTCQIVERPAVTDACKQAWLN